ncbi:MULTISPECIES: amidohydrolase family protein [Mycolicibacterium]|uniref:O-pyrocatechuate decarboxylase n=1 Tax=Mycolicibacterium senegalense TaxID=1796 RepID=A0A378W5Y0_9MYCO|nr:MULTISPECIES: amidohydrolase family protein [Mycolicibacterium]MCV7336092.1 amidohydrolase [Mycolicibacterium senegalense]MDR7287901.1 2,3-dihydroxybenzoate decarboxylase [Mycolicibacterium senegalense]QZA24905.1 amidohydrolase family protein [Mycolicibacterium senegalense]CDP86692.1 putative TIM-barrel fold metal-dependent hydrolase [Mycolicibacterium farcinogenes]SUA28523.1 O-pyrocatechuate decarboxylase [Mycolicibacterium senegalense]
MEDKIALEEHFAITEYNRVRPPFLGEPLWREVQRRIVDFEGERLAEMDRHGIAYSVISLTSPGVQGETDPRQAVERARIANDALAQAISAHPDRLGGFAAVALQDVDTAVAELDRAVRELGFHGVLINSWTNLPEGVGRLDEARFAPFWDRVAELDVPVYLHPRQLYPDQRQVIDGRPELSGPVWEFATDCSASALRLITSGLFDRHPGVQIILGHLGEGLPYDIWRIENRMRLAADQTELQSTPTEYLRRNFFVTTSGHFSTTSLLAALTVMGADRVMFSVDYPYEFTDQAAAWFDALDLDESVHRAIASGNAARLFDLKSEAAR